MPEPHWFMPIMFQVHDSVSQEIYTIEVLFPIDEVENQ